MTDVSLYLSTFFDLQYSFDKAEIPGLMDWSNPYDMPEKMVVDNWAVSNFTSADLKDSYLGLYDNNNSLAYAFRFNELPDWGNIGSLENRRIDALRFQYDISSIAVDETVLRSYEVVALSKNTYPALQPSTVQALFDYKPAIFNLATRDYIDYIERNNIGFIVYDKNVLDTKIVHSKMIELVYSNDRYVILKIIR
jgi:hypothetical protein